MWAWITKLGELRHQNQLVVLAGHQEQGFNPVQTRGTGRGAPHPTHFVSMIGSKEKMLVYNKTWMARAWTFHGFTARLAMTLAAIPRWRSP